MSTSRRHHYVPQFLLRNFAASDGFLFVYNKDAERVTKQSTKSAFFEMDRNTVQVGSEKTDTLEAFYADLDGDLAQFVKSLLQHRIIDSESITYLGYLAGLMKWRPPGQDATFNQLKGQVSLDDLRLQAVSTTGQLVDPEEVAKVTESELFKQSLRAMLPVPALYNDATMEDLLNHSFLATRDTARFPTLLGDCGLIENELLAYNELGNFVLPLSSTDTFIFKSGCRKQISSPILLAMNQDLAMLHSASKYVACSNKTYLDNIVAIYQRLKKENQLEKLTSSLFSLVL